MDMVRHQAIGPDIDGIPIRALLQEGEIVAIVVIRSKDILLIVAPLDDMMGVAGDNTAGQAGHGDRLPPVGAERRHADHLHRYDLSGSRERRI